MDRKQKIRLLNGLLRGQVPLSQLRDTRFCIKISAGGNIGLVNGREFPWSDFDQLLGNAIGGEKSGERGLRINVKLVESGNIRN